MCTHAWAMPKLFSLPCFAPTPPCPCLTHSGQWVQGSRQPLVMALAQEQGLTLQKQAWFHETCAASVPAAPAPTEGTASGAPAVAAAAAAAAGCCNHAAMASTPAAARGHFTPTPTPCLSSGASAPSLSDADQQLLVQVMAELEEAAACLGPLGGSSNNSSSSNVPDGAAQEQQGRCHGHSATPWYEVEGAREWDALSAQQWLERRCGCIAAAGARVGGHTSCLASDGMHAGSEGSGGQDSHGAATSLPDDESHAALEPAGPAGGQDEVPGAGVLRELLLFVQTVLSCDPGAVSFLFLLRYIQASGGVALLAGGPPHFDGYSPFFCGLEQDEFWGACICPSAPGGPAAQTRVDLGCSGDLHAMSGSGHAWRH